MKNVNRMTFNDNGELIVDGEIIPNSNVVDIINNAFRKKPKATEAYDKFLEVLSESAVPHEVLRDIVRPDRMVNDDVTPQQLFTSRQKSKRKNIKRFDILFPSESTPQSSHMKLSASGTNKQKRKRSTPYPSSRFSSWRNFDSEDN
jgi:hypothetical protein